MHLFDTVAGLLERTHHASKDVAKEAENLKTIHSTLDKKEKSPQEEQFEKLKDQMELLKEENKRLKSEIENNYSTPLSSRYSSESMRQLFSPKHRIAEFRRIWIAVAKAQRDLGLNITEEQIKELEDNKDNIDLDRINYYEFTKGLNHDVMANIHAYAELCPKAGGIIHQGLTSCNATDNADMLIFREALYNLKSKLIDVIEKLGEQAVKYKAVPCLGYTHYQVALPTTVGKRICMWQQNFCASLEYIDFTLKRLKFLGMKGATGTQDSFMELFDNDKEKVVEFDRKVGEYAGYSNITTIAGQTYSRHTDSRIVEALASIAGAAHEIGQNFRLWAHDQEVAEPFGKNQTGSSAMPFKKNPMDSEQICSLSREVIVDSLKPKLTAATQMFERSLDDSAGRRMYMAESFLKTDQILLKLIKNITGMNVYPEVIKHNLNRELPFLVTEKILMMAVKRGLNRQEVHEIIRVQSIAVKEKLLMNKPKDEEYDESVAAESLEEKEEMASRSESEKSEDQESNPDSDLDLLTRLDLHIGLTSEEVNEIEDLMKNPLRLTGRAEDQVLDYQREVKKLLAKSKAKNHKL